MSAALVVGSWHLHTIPPGWEPLPGYGLRRTGEGIFPSVLLMAEEPMPAGLNLAAYVANQLVAVNVLLKQPNIKGPAPAEIPGATEALRVGISYTSPDGRNVMQMQIYATGGLQVGNVTFTTLQEELPALSATFGDMIRNLSFQPPPIPAPVAP